MLPTKSLALLLNLNVLAHLDCIRSEDAVENQAHITEIRRISDLTSVDKIRELYSISLPHSQSDSASIFSGLLRVLISPVTSLVAKRVVRTDTALPSAEGIRSENFISAAILLKLIAEAVKSCLCAVDGIRYDSRAWARLAGDRHSSNTAALFSATTSDALVLECRRRRVAGREVKSAVLSIVGAARLVVAEADAALRSASDPAALAALASLAAFLKRIASCPELAAAAASAPPPPHELAAALRLTALGPAGNAAGPAAATPGAVLA